MVWVIPILGALLCVVGVALGRTRRSGHWLAGLAAVLLSIVILLGWASSTRRDDAHEAGIKGYSAAINLVMGMLLGRALRPKSALADRSRRLRAHVCRFGLVAIVAAGACLSPSKINAIERGVQAILGMATFHYEAFYLYPASSLVITGPVLFLAGVAGVIAAMLGWEPGRRHVEPEAHSCLKCGYLLCGLTEPRCPECGSTFTPLLPRQSVGSAPSSEPRNETE